MNGRDTRGAARSIARTRVARDAGARRAAAFAVVGAVLATLCASAMAGCGSREDAAPRRELTERQRDSVIGASDLPGAAGVKGALRESDDAARRAAAIDSMTK